MARLSKEEHDEILQTLSDRTNADSEMMNFIDRLRSDFDESLSVDYDESTRQWQEKYSNMQSERDKAIGERDEARRAYRERFFSNAKKESERIVDREKEDSPRGTDYILGIRRD